MGPMPFEESPGISTLRPMLEKSGLEERLTRGAGLEEILLALGIPQKVLDEVNASGLEEGLAHLRGA